MKTRHTNKWIRRAASVIAVLVLMMSSAGQASARVILFQDDALHDIDSEGILLNADDGGDGSDEDVTLQFGNDSTNATVTFTDSTGDTAFATPGGDFSFNDDNVASTGGLDFDGNINFTNASELHLREVADEAAATCTTVNELVVDTTENTIYICTGTGSPGSWTNVASASGTDLQGAYNADASGAHEIILSAGDGEALEIRANANGDDLLQLQNLGATNLINFQDLGGTTIDIDSLIVDWDATGAFSLDSSTSVHIGGGAASEFITTAGDITVDSQAGSVNIDGGEAVANAIWINASNAAGGIDVDAGTGGIDINTTGTAADSLDINVTGVAGGIDVDTTDGAVAITAAGAVNGDITLNSADTMTLDIDGDGIIDIEEGLNFDVGANLDIDVEGTGIFTLNTVDGGITLDAAGAANGDVIIGAGDDLTLDAVGLFEINSSGGVINIGNDDVDQAINVGTTGERTITIGNTTGATALDFNANGAIGINSDDGSVTIGADDTDNAANDNVVILSGNAAPDAGEDGNDIAFEAEDDVLIEATDAVDIDAASMDVTTSGQFAISTSAWDITGAGAASGFTTITASSDITTSGGDFIVGTTGLSETTAANDSGAFLVGTFDEFDNSASTNVQDVLDDLDALIGVNSPEVETLRFYPEYPDTIYDITATHKGTLESIKDAAEGNAYYWHSKANPGDMVMTLRMRMELPADFDDPNDLTLRYDTTDAVVANNYVGLELYNITDATVCGTTANSASAAWATLTLNEAGIEGGCNVGGGDALDAGDLIEIRISMMNDNGNSGEAYVGYVDLSYDN